MAASLIHYDRDGATAIVLLALAQAVAGVGQTARKVGIENSGDRILATSPSQLLATLTAVGSSDGASLLRIGLDTATLSKPWGVTTVLSAAGDGGVWSGTGTRGWRITATNTLGETIGSTEVTVNVDVVTKRVTLNWIQVPSATGYRIYRTDVPGTYGASTLRAIIGSGATITFIDDGTATTTGTPALTNTTAGWNLGLVLGATADGGVWSGTGLKFYSVAALDANSVVLTVSQENSINVDDVTKRVTISWSAVTGAATYRIYRSTTAGVYVSAVVTTTASLSFIDNGAATTVGDLTLGSSYGIPPVLSTVPITFGSDYPIGRQRFYWLNRVIPAATPEAGNPRAANVVFSES
jgi:cellulose 1,4-beta-cellobiosidase